MKYILKLSIILVVLAGFTSCSETYLDVNNSPNDPTGDNLDPRLTLGGALSRPGVTLLTTGSRLGSIMTNQWGGDINNFAAPFTDEYRLNVTATFYSTLWDNTYIRLNTNQFILDYELGGYENHQAIAKINKAFYFQYLVDLFGDVPYSEALKGVEILAPKYDDAQTIYRDLIVQLDAAIVQLKNGGDALPVGPEDIAFQGDLSKWVQVANTLKLRILLRQSELALTDGATQTYLNEQFANLENNFLTEDFTLNPGYVNSASQQNPFYESFGFDPSGIASQNKKLVVATNYFAEFLKGNTTEDGITTNVFDNRVDKLFEPVAGEVLGIIQGDVDANTPDDLSHVGDGLLKDSSQDLYLITAAESYFLQSEAVVRNYITGNAKDLFQLGITASFDIVDAADAANYIALSNSKDKIGWDGSANKIEAIMTQKWIASNGHNAIESFIEYNRTGFPAIPLALTAEQPQKPYRLLYPTSEYTANSANVPTQSTNDAFSDKIFWDAN